jgi:ribose transport system permease protein
MNETVKLGAALGGGFAIAAGAWFATRSYPDAKDHLPDPWSQPQTLVWFVLAAVAIGVLAYTFELTRRNLQRIAGVVLLLGGLLYLLGASSDTAFGRSNVFTVLSRHGEYGIVCIGAGLLILTGGIDLSLGSVVGLSAVGFGVLMENRVHPYLALPLVLLGGVLIGVVHGLLVTQLRVQAFLVTLCGMFVYRGLARTISAGSTGRLTVKATVGANVKSQHLAAAEPAIESGTLTGKEAEQAATEAGRAAAESVDVALLDLRHWLTGIGLDERLAFPAQFVLMLVIAAAVAVFLHRSAFGRYWYAIGYNAQAARYAGVTVWRHQVVVFALCAGLAALAGVMRFLSAGTVTPSSEGQSYELYAITAAVLGGVSLKGGEGTAVGMVLGAMVLPVVNTLMNFREIKSEWEPWIIGLILLFGTVVDELIRRRSKVSR